MINHEFENEKLEQTLKTLLDVDKVPVEFVHDEKAIEQFIISCKEKIDDNESLKYNQYHLIVTIYKLKSIIRLLSDVTKENLRKESGNKKYIDYVNEKLDRMNNLILECENKLVDINYE
ncbi:MAG: hypothetical protein ACOC1X_04930 [Promethearchaeota archaeon]